MTIKTAQEGDKKKTAQPLDDVVVTVEQGDSKPSPPLKAKAIRRQQKGKACGTVTFVLLLVLGLVCLGVGSYYIYSYLHPTKGGSRTCKIGVKDKASSASSRYLQEDVDVDEDRETINVPKFDENDHATFIHDWNQEISVIKDITDKVCYILPLDKKLIPRPRDFLDLIDAMTTGQYLLDADKIRSEYEVVHPELGDSEMITLYGSYIASSCDGFQSYKLREMDSTALSTTTTMATFMIQRKFVMYPGGSTMLQYVIYT